MPGLEGPMAEPVIGGLFLRVLQDVVGFVDLLELVLGCLVSGIGVRMILLGELAESALEFPLVGPFADAQNLIEITFRHGRAYH